MVALVVILAALALAAGTARSPFERDLDRALAATEESDVGLY